ncbi:MAG: DUF1080 domain-containing protein [Planctomycetota bacterium]|nr:MAG: DUF1080 domain-containing protein [Planctomycetota bacterium]
MRHLLSRRLAGLILVAPLALAGPARACCASPDLAERVAAARKAGQGPQPAEGALPLFDGKSLAGWWGAETEDPRAYLALPVEQLAAKKARSMADIQQHWRVEAGELVNDGNGLYLTTQELYSDFELWLEYKTVALADSGVYLRGCPQVQIWDTTEAGGKWNIGADKGSGGLWNNSPGAAGKDPLVKADKPFGEWNALRVRMIGERVSVWLNDALVVDAARMENYYDRKLALPRAGPIQLQTHGGEIRWRKVWLREIPASEANALLAADARDYEPVFDGKSFEGWRGADGWEIVDGALRCRKGSGGTIFTQREYGDFSARFEFLLPPGGNNGVAIRYPGSGDAAYAGMCECQVIDSEDPRYAKLDARQFHGSAYGMVAAQRGYLRAPGEWNFEQITVRGSTIQVELNGTRILDADLATVKDALYPLEQFAGRLRTSGHFGFAGHDDPVAFRAVKIRRL